VTTAQLFFVVAPLRLTLWVVAVATVVVLVVIAIAVSRHLEWIRFEHHHERVRAELEPVFSRFFEDEDPARLADELRPAFLRMDAAERPVAAVLISDLMQDAPLSHRELLRSALEQSGIVELGEKGTRRRSPWRRALACEMLGKIGSPLAVPALLQRLEDRRPEVRVAAVRALGDIGSPEAAPVLGKAFLDRTVAPTNVVNDALRRIGGEFTGPTFERGVASSDPIVRVSSCFGLAGVAAGHGAAVHRLAAVLGSDSEARVRVAAAASLGIAGGGAAPPELVGATTDPEDAVRRSAVKALGSFDDPTTADSLDARTEDEDREVAIRAAEALLALSRRPRAAAEARARLDSSSAWAVEYVQKVAEVTG
jgi:HEAT repeat protein